MALDRWDLVFWVGFKRFLEFDDDWLLLNIKNELSTPKKGKKWLTQGSEGRLNLNFQARLYGVAFLNSWNMIKYPILNIEFQNRF